jgi:hypothetical protein
VRQGKTILHSSTPARMVCHVITPSLLVSAPNVEHTHTDCLVCMLGTHYPYITSGITISHLYMYSILYFLFLFYLYSYIEIIKHLWYPNICIVCIIEKWTDILFAYRVKKKYEKGFSVLAAKFEQVYRPQVS